MLTACSFILKAVLE